MRRIDGSALSMPAAVQRNTICPSRQRVTLRLVVRAMEIIDSIGLLVVSVLASRPSMPRRAREHLLQPFAQRRRRTGVALIHLPGQGVGVAQPPPWVGVAGRLYQPCVQ